MNTDTMFEAEIRALDKRYREAAERPTPVGDVANESVRMRDVPARSRASWDSYFMAIAGCVATRATCDRRHVGAVIVRDHVILTTGYNGSIRGLPHCDDVGHEMVDGHCVRTVHAEANAIVQAARNGVRLEGGTIYITASPCFGCFKLIANAGLTRIVFGDVYRDSIRDSKLLEMSNEIGIALEYLPVDNGDPARRVV